MSKKLLIVESPSKAKTISKYLGNDFEVMASVGHIRDLPKSNKKAIDVEGGFIPTYEISKGKEKIVSEIKEKSKKADEVLLATDPDREGEAIAWHIKEAAKLKHPKRIVFHEITKEAVIEAIKTPREIDENLKEAQEARRVLDRLVGYDLSGIIWKKVRYGLSAGRVQSPALRIIMEREIEIRNFKSEDYFLIFAQVLTENKEKIELQYNQEIKNEKEALRILASSKKAGEDGLWLVKNIKNTEISKSPRPPLITSTLQQSASSRLGFSPAKTMRLAQKLYESGAITYMRTDSTNISSTAIKQISELIKKEYGGNDLEIKKFKTKSKNAQEAHEAIRPTNFLIKKTVKDRDENSLYNLIWQRTVASQMKPAKIMRTKLIVKADKIEDFFANGQKITYLGFMKVDKDSESEERQIPKVSIGQKLDLQKIYSEKKETEPPYRYSEAGLVKELEKRGIGRPSTYASIIKTLEDREYVSKINKALVPTDTGDVVSSFLEKNFPEYISDDFTAEMENKLDLIAEGKHTYIKTLKDFYGPFLKEVKEKDKLQKATNLGEADEKFKCPVCGKGMSIKLGRAGKFLSCSDYPDCDGALTIDGTEIKKDEPIGINPSSGFPIFILFGKYGPYVQEGEKDKKNKIKPRMASIPKDKDLSSITINDALKYLSLPKELGINPKNQKPVNAGIGRFGPYIVCDGDFRSLKTDDVYEINLERALEILSEPKKQRVFRKKSNS